MAAERPLSVDHRRIDGDLPVLGLERTRRGPVRHDLMVRQNTPATPVLLLSPTRKVDP